MRRGPVTDRVRPPFRGAWGVGRGAWGVTRKIVGRGGLSPLPLHAPRPTIFLRPRSGGLAGEGSDRDGVIDSAGTSTPIDGDESAMDAAGAAAHPSPAPGSFGETPPANPT